MKKLLLATVLVMACAASAQARVNVGVGIYTPAPVYYAPQPAYYPPPVYAPAPIVYYAPPRYPVNYYNGPDRHRNYNWGYWRDNDHHDDRGRGPRH